MALSVFSYEKLPVLADKEGLLNLAWTLDERAYLAVDLAQVILGELAAEVRQDLPFVNSYFVQDPYGDGILGEAVARFFSQSGWECRVTCCAGVNSLLHALAHLADGQPAYVIGDVYPDFPHWIERFGGICSSQYSEGNRHGHIANVVNSGASVVLMDRPALSGEEMSLSDLGELCDGVAPSGAIVVVDESYANYYPPSFSAANIVPEARNLAVVRGLSKAYWLGGLRLGYCVASTGLTERIRGVMAPMLASSLSLRIGRAILDLGDVTPPLRERVPAAKAETLALLEAAGLRMMPPSTEYLPYLLCSGRDPEGRHVLESRGIIGKLQPFWTESVRAVTFKYRLSVPLSQERMDQLRRKIGAAEGDAGTLQSEGS